MIRRKVILPIAALVLLAGIGYGTGQVSAQNMGLNHHQDLISKLAEKLGVSEAQVQSVFEEIHQERHTLMEQQFNNRLEKLVANGTITSAQKQAILDKHAQIQAVRQSEIESWQNLSPEERRAQMDAKRDELETWAEENSINLDGVFNGLGFHNGKGLGFSRHHMAN